MWQKARFVNKKDHPPFWVVAEEPKAATLSVFDEDKRSWGSSNINSKFYLTNILSPVAGGPVCLYATQEDVELLAEFADDVAMDERFL